MNLLRSIFRLLLGSRLPLTQGSLHLPGLHGRVHLHRDRWGIPLIQADHPLDGPFALGFCHGQDRAFQLEILLRVSRGTVAEMAGEAALPVDRFSRRIGFHRAAVEQWSVLDEEVRTALESYAQGVQAGISKGCPTLPHEFALLGITPTTWTPCDSLALTKLLSFTLMANWDAELVRLKVLTTDGPDALRALDATYPAWHPVISPVGAQAGQAIDHLAHDLEHFFQWTNPNGCSNAWALAGSRTVSGKPLLANDPHLTPTLPSHWYLASLRTPHQATAGATFVGGPLFLVGHNGHAAWGLTAGLADNTDLFQEELSPDHTAVRQGTDFLPCRVVEEVISVKGRSPVTERVLITPRGPIVSPVLADTSQALSLRATWLDPLPLGGFFLLPAVRSFDDLRKAFVHWPVSSQNVVYADSHGTIGWQLVGRLPIRKKGHGTLPLTGADPQAGWHEAPIPTEQMPHLLNPACGYVATANNLPTAEGNSPFLGLDFLDGYRASAIDRALRHRHDWDVPSTMKLQMDQYAIAWEEMSPFVLSVEPVDLDSALALEMLRSWDGRVSPDSVPASVYEVFLAEMIVRVAKAKAPRSWRWVVGAGLTPVTRDNFGCFRRTGHLVRLLRDQPPGWFPHPWPEEIAAALGEAVRRLNAKHGPQTTSWTWGATRPLILHHPLTKKPGLLGKALGAIFNLGPIPCGGDADVINQAAVPPLDPFAPTDNIPSLRAVFDLGDWSQCRFVLPGGQSGNPFSPHYGDLLPLWQRGEGVPIPFTPDEVRQATVESLLLEPHPPGT